MTVSTTAAPSAPRERDHAPAASTASPRPKRGLRARSIAAASALALTAGLAVTVGAGHAAASAPTSPAYVNGIAAISLADAGPNALKLAWSPVTGASTYQIRWLEQGTGRSWSSQNNYRASDSPVTLTGLLPRHGYTVSVTASGTYGITSEPVSATRWTTGAPANGTPGGIASISLGNAGINALRVTWSQAPGADRYQITWSDLTDRVSFWRSKPDYTAASRPATLTGLTPGHLYRVLVSSFDNAGEGGYATAVRATPVATGVTAPAAVGSVVVTTAGPGQLKVSWTPVSGATRYRIGWYNVDRDHWTSNAPDYAAGDSPVILTNVPAGLPTEVRVTPYNDGGTGPTTVGTATPR